MKKNAVALLAVTLLAAPAVSFGAMAGANTVNSAAIVDGSIATVDIANLAVTTAKIANGAVSATQLASGAITDVKVSDVAMGKVTGLATALATKANSYRNVIVVASSGGNYTNPVDAMNAITDASAANPYLVKVMPGVYNVNSSSVQMKPFVDIEGSGEMTTKIVGSSSGWAVLFGASNAELRFISVEQTGTIGSRVAIRNDSASPKISHVTAISSTGTNGAVANMSSDAIFTDVTMIAQGLSTTGGNFGMENVGGAPVFTNVTVNVTDSPANYGIFDYDSASVYHNLTVAAAGPTSYGIYTSGTPTFDGITVNAASIGLNVLSGTTRVNNGNLSAQYAVGSSGALMLSNSMINGTATGFMKCLSVYDSNLNAVTCP